MDESSAIRATEDAASAVIWGRHFGWNVVRGPLERRGGLQPLGEGTPGANGVREHDVDSSPRRRRSRSGRRPAAPTTSRSTPAAGERFELGPAGRRARTRRAPRRREQSRPSSRAARPAGRGRASSPTPPAIAISASAQASPPSLTSWAAVSRAGADRVANERDRGGHVLDRQRGQPGPELAAELRQLRAGERGRERPADGDRVPSASATPPARRGPVARRPCRSRVWGRSGRPRSRCRARRCRLRPGSRAPRRRRRGPGSSGRAARRRRASRGCRS